MTCITESTPKRRPSTTFVVGLAIASILAVGTFARPASADWDGDHRGGYHHGYHNDYNGGYYRSPPVVYGSSYGNSYYGSPYYAPPVVYGPGIGINLPGVSIGIR